MTTPPFACALTAWRQHQSELKGYLLHRLSDPVLADDLLQDVFLKAMRQGAAFCALENPRAWLFQVARNAVADQFRLAKDYVPLAEDLTDDEDVTEPVDALVGCMERVLTELPDADGDVIRQCDLQGMTLQRYADARGLTLPAVKSRIQRARQRMRERMILVCQVQFDEAGSVCCHVPRTPA